MLIQLDGYFSPERIVEAFLSALPTTKHYGWVYETVQAKCIEEGKTTNQVGIRAHLVYKHKEFLFFGDEVIKEGNLHFSLKPIADDYPHYEVEITPLYGYKFNKEGSVIYTCEDPESEHFKKALPIWNSFLENFKEKLLDSP